jgi:hypothetical protein
MKSTLFAFAFLLSISAQSALLSYEAGPKNLAAITLNKTASINDAKGSPTNLKMDLLGAGIRTKTVLVVEAKVYVLQLFSDNKAGFVRDSSALSSLIKNSNRIALKIDMLRTVSASAMSESFKEAIEANGYAIDSELNNILGLFSNSADANQGKTLTLLMTKDLAQNKSNIYYEDAKGSLRSVVASPEVMTKIMSIWLGAPADSGLEKLKTELLKPVY